jgi:hypothetical protein
MVGCQEYNFAEISRIFRSRPEFDAPQADIGDEQTQGSHQQERPQRHWLARNSVVWLEQLCRCRLEIASADLGDSPQCLGVGR